MFFYSVCTVYQFFAISGNAGMPSDVFLFLFTVRTRWMEILGLIPKGDIQYTDKKENQIFLIYMEIQSGAVAKSYIGKGF